MSGRGLKLVSWNCAGGVQKKWPELLRRINFDVAVLTECGPLPAILAEDQERGVTQVVRQPVANARIAKHIGVFARAPWRVEEVHDAERFDWLVHARVTDTLGIFETFDVLAVWGLAREYSGLGYAEQTTKVIDGVLARMPGDLPVVLAGDLNTPIESSKPDSMIHNANVARLRELDLWSAFTATHTTSPKPRATFYAQRKRERAFHIDHVFVPYGWCNRHGFGMSVGSFDDWVASRLSDHVPLVVNVPWPDGPRRKTWEDPHEDQFPNGPGVRGGVKPMGEVSD